MKTASYTYVLQRATELTGRVYSALTTEEATLFRGYIARALRWAWEHYPWPDLMVYSQEFFAPIWDSTTSYPAGTVVYYKGTGTYYVACQVAAGVEPATQAIATDTYTPNFDYWQYAKPDYSGNNGGNWISTKVYTKGDVVFDSQTATYYSLFATAPAGTAVTNTTYWFALTPFIRVVDKSLNPDGTTRTTEIGEVFNIFINDPRVTLQQPRLDREFIGQSLYIRYLMPFVWLYWRQAPPPLASDPSTIPYRFAEIVAGKAAGSMLVLDGKAEIGSALIALATDDLNDEADKVGNQEGQVQATIVYAR